MKITQPCGKRAGVAGTLLRAVTAIIALSALGIAMITWIDLSRPFDPARVVPLTVAAANIAVPPPTYPGAITVLTYHDVSDEGSSSATLDRRTFARHMATLADLGYRTIPLTTVRDLVRHRPVKLPERPLLLTFDDGSLSTWTTIDPVLERYQFTAVAFLTTDLLVEPGTPSYFLSTRQVQQLHETGRWEFGSHTAAMDKLAPIAGDVQAPLTNRILQEDGEESAAQWRERVADDLARSQERLKELTGSTAVALSYPFGDGGSGSNVAGIGTELPKLLDENGFDIAFVGENVPTGHIDAVTESSPRWLLPRIGVRSSTTVQGLLQMVGESIPTPLPAQLTGLSWAGENAECVPGPDAVTVKGIPGVYGVCALSDVNTSRWLDYALDVHVKGLSPHTSAVVGVRDGAGAGHYGRVEVVVGVSRIVIRQRIGSAPLEELRTVRLSSRTRRALHVEVRGDEVSVHADGGPTVTSSFDRRLHEGGITLARIGTGDLRFGNSTLTNNSVP